MIISERIHRIPFQRILIVGGPIILVAEPDRNMILSSLLDILKKWIPKETVFLEIRNLSTIESDRKIFEKKGFTWQDHLNDVLQLRLEKDVWSGIKPSKQRQIRRGLEKEAIIRPAENINEVMELYSILHELYKTIVKKPLPPLPCL